MTDLQAAVDALEQAANATLIERSVEVHIVVAALLSRSHVFFRSEPGEAKTFLARTMVGLIGPHRPGDFFDWELERFSDPAELFGPHDPQAFKRGHLERNPAGKLPQAKIAHIGEIWEAASGTLNYLRPILNERLFYNDHAGPQRVPLVTLLCDANETPEAVPRLRALYDRITFRYVSQPIQGRGNYHQMLRDAVARRATIGYTSVPDVRTVIDWDTLEAAQAEVRAVTLADEVYEALGDLRSDLAAQGVHPSSRRMAESTGVIQAAAWRAGRPEARPEDMTLLAHVLWSKTGDAPIVQRMIFGLVSPLDKAALEISDEVDELVPQIKEILAAAPSQTRKRRALEARRKMESAADRLVAVRDQARTSGHTLTLFAPLAARVMGLGESLLAALEDRRTPLGDVTTP